jgi:hypothetical protein
MKAKPVCEHKPLGRMEFLALLGGLGAGGVAYPFRSRRKTAKELSLREADFYRPHGLAG